MSMTGLKEFNELHSKKKDLNVQGGVFLQISKMQDDIFDLIMWAVEKEDDSDVALSIGLFYDPYDAHIAGKAILMAHPEMYKGFSIGTGKVEDVSDGGTIDNSVVVFDSVRPVKDQDEFVKSKLTFKTLNEFRNR